MKGYEIIKCLCYLGNTEHAGVVIAESDTCTKEYLEYTFKGYADNLIVDGIVKTETNYLYCYNDRLAHPEKGEIGADVVITTYGKKGLIDRIYLYEIE